MVVVRSVSEIDLDGGGQVETICGSSALMSIDYLDDVGARLTPDVEDDGGGGVGPSAELAVLGAADDLGDIRQPDRAAIVIGDDQGAVFARDWSPDHWR